MKIALVLSLLLGSQSVLANGYDDACMYRYRTATQLMVQHARSFNHGEMNAPAFVAAFSAVEMAVGVQRMVCTFESPEAKKCVGIYKRQYHGIRNEINVVRILNGTQKKVNTGLVEVGMAWGDVRCSDFVRDLFSTDSEDSLF